MATNCEELELYGRQVKAQSTKKFAKKKDNIYNPLASSFVCYTLRFVCGSHNSVLY